MFPIQNIIYHVLPIEASVVFHLTISTNPEKIQKVPVGCAKSKSITICSVSISVKFDESKQNAITSPPADIADLVFC